MPRKARERTDDCRECGLEFTYTSPYKRTVCSEKCRLERMRQAAASRNRSSQPDPEPAVRGYSIGDLQWSNPERFARQVDSILSGVKPLCGTTKNPSAMEEVLDILIKDPLHQKDLKLVCDAALLVYVKCDHSVHSAQVGSMQLLEKLRKFAALNPERLFGTTVNEVFWSCRLPLEPTSMKNGKIMGRYLTAEARQFKKDAVRLMKSDGEWKTGSAFAENDLIGMTCQVRYSSFRKDMDLELVKDCLQLAKIIPNDKMIFDEHFKRDFEKGSPEILVTLKKIGTASWK